MTDSSFLLQEQQRQAVDKLLTDGARGFVDTGDQDRYDECETAVNEVLKNIKRLAPRFKVRFKS